MHGVGAFDQVAHLVTDTDVGEGSSGHDEIVASSGAVGVEVLGVDAVGLEPLGGGGGSGDLAGRRDVVGGDGVTNVEEAVGALDVGDNWEFLGHTGEEGGLVDVGALGPSVDLTGLGLQTLPKGTALGDVGVHLSELFVVDGGGYNLGNLVSGGPDVLEEDVVAFGVLADGLGGEVDVDSSSQSVGYNERG